jgi:hypothetical protein
MESRIIRITDETVSWAKQIESTAGTLGELKRELDNAGINYSGKEFHEGRSRTMLTDDQSLLPDTVMFRGNPTRELSIILMTPDKKVSSGTLSRKEINQMIVSGGLQENVKKEFGRNYTQVSSDNLTAFITKMERASGNKKKAQDKKEEVLEAVYDTGKEDRKEENKPEPCGTESVWSAARLDSLLNCLYNKGILSDTDINSIREGSVRKNETETLLSELKKEFKYLR